MIGHSGDEASCLKSADKRHAAMVSRRLSLTATADFDLIVDAGFLKQVTQVGR
jgi:hypothetical protein